MGSCLFTNRAVCPIVPPSLHPHTGRSKVGLLSVLNCDVAQGKVNTVKGSHSQGRARNIRDQGLGLRNTPPSVTTPYGAVFTVTTSQRQNDRSPARWNCTVQQRIIRQRLTSKHQQVPPDVTGASVLWLLGFDPLCCSPVWSHAQEPPVGSRGCYLIILAGDPGTGRRRGSRD